MPDADPVPAVRAAVPEATSSSSTTTRPTERVCSPDELAAADAHVRLIHRVRKQAPRHPVPRGVPGRARRGRGLAAHRADGRRLLARSERRAAAARPPRRRRRSRDRLALHGGEAAARRTGAWARRLISRGGGLYAQTVLGVSVRDLTAGFKALKSDTLRGIDLDAVAAKGYGFQIEMTFRALPERLPRRRAAHQVRRSPRRPVEDVGHDLLRGAHTLVWSLRARVPQKPRLRSSLVRVLDATRQNACPITRHELQDQRSRSVCRAQAVSSKRLGWIRGRRRRREQRQRRLCRDSPRRCPSDHA